MANRVKIFKRVESGPMSGAKVVKAVAMTFEARRGMGDHTRARAARAKSILNTADVRTGDSYITIERGGLDLYVTLNDERGQGAANIIEFGRHPLSEDSSPSYAVAPLGHAFGFANTGRRDP